MSGPVRRLSLRDARRFIVAKQRLAGPLPRRPGKKEIESVVRELCYVQIDPVNILAPGHLLTFWSRLGHYRTSDLDELLWKEKRLLYLWSHAASIVSAEDYPLFHSLQTRYPESLSKSWGAWRDYARRWIPRHAALRRKILRQLKGGPLRLGDFEDHARTARNEGGWGSWSEVAGMLNQLQFLGEVCLVGRDGNQNLYGLCSEFLPKWIERGSLSVEQVERQGIERSIRAQGLASAQEINFYYLRGRYLHLKEILAELEAESVVHRVAVDGGAGSAVRYVHDADLAGLDALLRDWEPRLSLLSPFDSFLCRRDRISRLFGFDYAHENYVPREKRKFGVYVVPILWGDRFVGRLDPRLDRERGALILNAVHAEPAAAHEAATARAVRSGIEDLAEFVGAKEIVYPERLPSAWKSVLR